MIVVSVKFFSVELQPTDFKLELILQTFHKGLELAVNVSLFSSTQLLSEFKEWIFRSDSA